ncbi:MAG: cytochrome c biogenesis protein CcdA, partial [Kiritimatiellae bacterium]|nr:cytochrome c biogenesis protein CcdA [Kiritimatiellia bacterium]
MLFKDCLRGTQLIKAVLLAALFPSVSCALIESPFGLEVGVETLEGVEAEVRVAVTIPTAHLVYAEAFKVADGKGAGLEPVTLPKADRKDDPAAPGHEVEVYSRSFESVWRWRSPGPDAVLRVSLQGCDDKVCFMPEEHLFGLDLAAGTLVALKTGQASDPAVEAGWAGGLAFHTGGGYMGAGDFLSFLDQSDGGAALHGDGGRGLAGFLRDPVAFFQRHGLALTLLLVLLGGILLNLTPCVLPMMPINLAIIGAGAGTRGRGFVLGGAYGGGIVLVYGGLGWLILRSGLFFGALQSSPWFSLAVALVFAVLSLALFDVLVIDLTRFLSMRESGHKGLAAAFSAGALSALLAGACVAPVVLAVLLLAGTLYAGGASGAQFLPFVLGLGMALPWPLAGAGLSVMPNPGQWMVRVKQVFGILLAVLALYYFYLAAVGFMPASNIAREGSITAGDREAWQARLEQA